MNYRKMLVTLMLGALTACQGPAGENGAAGPAGETGAQGEQGVAGDNGADGEDLAAPEAAIASVAPNALLVGRTTTIRIVGYFTEWDETTTVRLTDMENADIEGIEVTTVVVSSVGLVATVAVADDVALGAVKMHVTTGDNMLHYMPEGASVTVTATATLSQSEIRAGDQYDVLIETAEFMANPTLNMDNCEGASVSQISRYSQYKFSVSGLMHPAMSLGDCAMVLIQDPDTDDEWSSAAIVTITAPDVITFNEGVVAGDNAVLTPERPFRVVAVSAAANEVVSIRHTVDEGNNLDGTGPRIDVFVEGNIEPIAVHDGSDRWLEIPNVEARELLVSVRDFNLEAGDDPVSFNLTQIVPNTVMTALQDGATQDQRLPANEGGANEAGRGSWYTITNETPVWATLAIAPADEATFQSLFRLGKDDSVLGTAETSWEGVLDAGTYVLGVVDTEQGETDGILSFGVQLSRTTVLNLDENGAAAGTLNTGVETIVLVPATAGHVTHISATRDGEGDSPNISATWTGADAPVATGAGTVHVPSIEGGNLVVRVSLEGDLGDNGVPFNIAVTSTEPTVLDIAGTEGVAPETGRAWYIGQSYGNLTLNVTPGTADHLQTGLEVYGANGGSLGAVSANTIEAGEVLGGFFVSVSDGEFVADQDQTFSISATIVDPDVAECVETSIMLETPANETMSWSYQGLMTNLVPVGYSSWNMAPHIITVTEPSTLDAFIASPFDSRLLVLAGCSTTSMFRPGDTTLAANDDGDNWNGDDLGGNAGINNLTLQPGQYLIGVTYYYRPPADSSPYTLHYRLRAQ